MKPIPEMALSREAVVLHRALDAQRPEPVQGRPTLVPAMTPRDAPVVRVPELPVARGPLPVAATASGLATKAHAVPTAARVPEPGQHRVSAAPVVPPAGVPGRPATPVQTAPTASAQVPAVVRVPEVPGRPAATSEVPRLDARATASPTPVGTAEARSTAAVGRVPGGVETATRSVPRFVEPAPATSGAVPTPAPSVPASARGGPASSPDTAESAAPFFDFSRVVHRDGVERYDPWG